MSFLEGGMLLITLAFGMEADALDICDIIEVFDDAHGLTEFTS
jgi:hypothetical protein